MESLRIFTRHLFTLLLIALCSDGFLAANLPLVLTTWPYEDAVNAGKPNIFEPGSNEGYKLAYATIEDSDQTAHSRHVRIQRGGQGVRTPLKNHKDIAILVRIPCKTTKLPSQHSMLGHQRPASETPFKWRFAGGPMMARL